MALLFWRMNMNYYSDHRVRAQEKWYTSFDESTMTAEITIGEETHTVPVTFGVCPTCEGKGSHVNPSIDCDGLTQRDFEESPCLHDAYKRGDYDVACYGCGGKRVVPVAGEMDSDLKKKWEKEQEEREDFRQMQESEMRYGA
jgi:hypothetical protein